MNTLIICKKDLDKNNFYKHSESLLFNGDIILKGNLGCVKFKKSLYAKGEILANEGTSIQVGKDIKGYSIDIIGNIKGKNIKTEGGIEAKGSIEVEKNIIAGWGIRGINIKAGQSIKATKSIESTLNIIAGNNIIAGKNIITGYVKVKKITRKWKN